MYPSRAAGETCWPSAALPRWPATLRTGRAASSASLSLLSSCCCLRLLGPAAAAAAAELAPAGRPGCASLLPLPLLPPLPPLAPFCPAGCPASAVVEGAASAATAAAPAACWAGAGCASGTTFACCSAANSLGLPDAFRVQSICGLATTQSTAVGWALPAQTGQDQAAHARRTAGEGNQHSDQRHQGSKPPLRFCPALHCTPLPTHPRRRREAAATVCESC